MAGLVWLTVLCICVSICSIDCVPLIQELTPPTADELLYMKRYGYLHDLVTPEDSEEDLQLAYTSHSVIEAVRKLQAFAGIPQTGVLDNETKKWFNKKRCGVKDIITSKRNRRAVISQGWSSKTVTYRVLNGSRTLPKPRVEDLMTAALTVWAPHGGLHFVKLDHGKADIEVSFVTRDHGDVLAFDGPGLALAHAFGPPIGAMHFDDDENWTDSDDEEDLDLTDFYAVAVHEVGHALGLYHSNVTSSVMYPYYQGTVELDADDISGMHQIYLKDQLSEDATENAIVAPFTKTEPEPEVEEYPDLCDMNYDTIQAMQGRLFVFEDEWMWILSGRKEIEIGYPKKIRDVFTGLPQQVTVIRAVYERQDGTIVIFSGRKYFEFDATFKLKRKGNLSHYKLPRHVAELSTVLQSNYNNKTYLIDYERFWRFDESSGQMDKRYPKSMAAWRDVPYPVDAAIIWDGDTYFFQGPRFWRFDNVQVQAHAYYPLPVAPVWFPCDFTVEMLRYTRNIT